MKTSFSLLSVALGLTGWSVHAHAASPPQTAHTGMTEIGDGELADMRGKYTEDNQTVAYFGVTMASSWTTASGQQLQSAMAVNIDLTSAGQPVVTFTPTVNITHVTPAHPTSGQNLADATIRRSADSSGLNNVSGLVQGVQVAGDSNVAGNVTALNLHQEDSATSAATATAPHSPAGNPAQQRSIQDGPAMASARVDDSGVQLALNITGQGAVQQWIRNGSLGQTISLTSDGSRVQNSIQLDLVQRSLASNVNLNRDFAQSLNQVRSFGLAF